LGRGHRSTCFPFRASFTERERHVFAHNVWINRFVLLAATLIFSGIGLRFIGNPQSAAAGRGIVLNSPMALTTLRIGLGGFPLALAIVTLACLISTHRHVIGVWVVMTVITTAIVVRLVGVVMDGAAPEGVRLFIPEGVLLTLCVTSLLLGQDRRRNYEKLAV
jgi:hypothetical protein